MTRLRSEDGFALASAIIVLLVLIALGLGIAVFSDSQQRAAGRQQSTEAAYALAEAALNAQIFQLSQRWANTTNAASDPMACTPATAGATPGCPDPSSLSTAYPVGNTAACPTATPGDAWGSSSGTQWATYVRDDGPGNSAYFNSSAAQGLAQYDANANGSVWVRSVATANCRTVVLVTKASEQLQPITWFPQYVLNANGFTISNHGNKVELDAKGLAPQPSQLSVRCTGLSGPGPNTTCSNYPNSVQISSGPNWATPAAPYGASPAQLSALKATAIANGTYWPNSMGACPTTAAQLSGAPAYIEGPCTLKFTGGTANSSAQPGFLVLVNGTIELNGGATFYGVIYAVNAQGTGSNGTSCVASPSTVVSIHGGAQVIGSVDVDGCGTVNLGDTGNASVNLKYDPTALQMTKVLGGAAPTPNTFRQLPQGQ